MKYLALSVALTLALVGCDEKAAAPADIAAGKAIAETQCVGCHGLDGVGKAAGIPNLGAQVEKYLLDSLHAYEEGVRTHAALKNLTHELDAADLRNVAGYYASLPPAEAASSKGEVQSPYEKGKAAAAGCVDCHGDDGNSTTPGIPSLAGQQPRYFVSAVRAYRDGRREKPTMEMLGALDAVDLESLALFYASQTPATRKASAFGDPVAGEPLTARCGGCHGADGVSMDTATPTLAGQDPQYLAAAIKGYRDQARHHDVMRDDNTDKEIEDIAAFYAAQGSKAAEGGPLTVQKLAEKCERCHGPEVNNPAMVIPKISGQDRVYLIMSLRAYRDGRRGSSMMHNMSLPYSETIIESVASLYASQPSR
ncbi:MAG: c-type cytochrome [Proteobacteria bacterium]|nr:c-type cytochrome [Pseudomonadota bacterium]MCK4868330.1 c-type cytochrome [Alphaproteobacteria bacterium]